MCNGHQPVRSHDRSDCQCIMQPSPKAAAAKVRGKSRHHRSKSWPVGVSWRRLRDRSAEFPKSSLRDKCHCRIPRLLAFRSASTWPPSQIGIRCVQFTQRTNDNLRWSDQLFHEFPRLEKELRHRKALHKRALEAMKDHVRFAIDRPSLSKSNANYATSRYEQAEDCTFTAKQCPSRREFVKLHS